MAEGVTDDLHCHCQLFCAKGSLGAYWWGKRLRRRWEMRNVICEKDIPQATIVGGQSNGTQ